MLGHPAYRTGPLVPVMTALWCGALVLLSGIGSARSQARDPAPDQTIDWTGFHVGGHSGYSFGTVRSGVDGATTSNGFGSQISGFQTGFDYQLPSRLVLGAEADITFPNFLTDGIISQRPTARSGLETQIEDLGTVRARVGYAFGKFLVYGTGGFAWSQGQFTESPGPVNSQDQIMRLRTGWAAGLGAEVAITPDWAARAEYLHAGLGSTTVIFPSGTRYQSSFDINMLRLGVDYRFGGPEQPSVDPLISSDDWNIHGQLTLIGQGYPPFHSPYEGPQSLSGHSQFTNTLSQTTYMGFRPWDGTEFYVDPELMQGYGLSGTYGVAGFPNGEAQKSGFPYPRANIARVFIRQVFGLGGEQEDVEDGPNQLPGKRDISRITVSVGKFPVLDGFDVNGYANDPREDFLNWNIYGGGSYDVTMDKVGYTWGAFVELNQPAWAVRAGYFLAPTTSNANTFDMRIPGRGEYAAEMELRYTVFSQPGKARLFGWVNNSTAGNYADAVALPLASANYPDISQTRKVRSNPGFVFNIEQAITGDLGVFSRISWDGGQTEKIGWTDCDESLSLGAVLKGGSWGRPDDVIGLGGVIEGLSNNARAYFAAGGLGILIGDGQLRYRTERVLETFYSYAVTKSVALTADYQLIVNPAYNADRGPASIFAGRLHAEF